MLFKPEFLRAIKKLNFPEGQCQEFFSPASESADASTPEMSEQLLKDFVEPIPHLEELAYILKHAPAELKAQSDKLFNHKIQQLKEQGYDDEKINAYIKSLNTQQLETLIQACIPSSKTDEPISLSTQSLLYNALFQLLKKSNDINTLNDFLTLLPPSSILDDFENFSHDNQTVHQVLEEFKENQDPVTINTLYNALHIGHKSRKDYIKQLKTNVLNDIFFLRNQAELADYSDDDTNAILEKLAFENNLMQFHVKPEYENALVQIFSPAVETYNTLQNLLNARGVEEKDIQIKIHQFFKLKKESKPNDNINSAILSPFVEKDPESGTYTVHCFLAIPSYLNKLHKKPVSGSHEQTWASSLANNENPFFSIQITGKTYDELMKSYDTQINNFVDKIFVNKPINRHDVLKKHLMSIIKKEEFSTFVENDKFKAELKTALEDFFDSKTENDQTTIREMEGILKITPPPSPPDTWEHLIERLTRNNNVVEVLERLPEKFRVKMALIHEVNKSFFKIVPSVIPKIEDLATTPKDKLLVHQLAELAEIKQILIKLMPSSSNDIELLSNIPNNFKTQKQRLETLKATIDKFLAEPNINELLQTLTEEEREKLKPILDKSSKTEKSKKEREETTKKIDKLFEEASQEEADTTTIAVTLADTIVQEYDKHSARLDKTKNTPESYLDSSKTIIRLIHTTECGKPLLNENELKKYHELISRVKERLTPEDFLNCHFKINRNARQVIVKIPGKEDQKIEFEPKLTLPFAIIKSSGNSSVDISIGGSRGNIAPLKGIDSQRYVEGGAKRSKERFFTHCLPLGYGQYGVAKIYFNLDTGTPTVRKEVLVPMDRVDTAMPYSEKALRDPYLLTYISKYDEPNVEMWLLKQLKSQQSLADLSKQELQMTEKVITVPVQTATPPKTSSVPRIPSLKKPAITASAATATPPPRSDMQKTAAAVAEPPQQTDEKNVSLYQHRSFKAVKMDQILASGIPFKTYADQKNSTYSSASLEFHDPVKRNTNNDLLLTESSTLAKLSLAILQEAERLKNLGFTHNDIKPENFLFQEAPLSEHQFKVSFIDFATAGCQLSNKELTNGEEQDKKTAAKILGCSEEELTKQGNSRFTHNDGRFVEFYESDYTYNYGRNPVLDILDHNGKKQGTLSYLYDVRSLPQKDNKTVLEHDNETLDNWALMTMIFGICNKDSYFELSAGRKLQPYVIPGVIEIEQINGIDKLKPGDKFDEFFAVAGQDNLMYIPSTRTEGEPLHFHKRLKAIQELIEQNDPLYTSIQAILDHVEQAVASGAPLSKAILMNLMKNSLQILNEYQRRNNPEVQKQQQESEIFESTIERFDKNRPEHRPDKDLPKDLEIICLYPSSPLQIQSAKGILSEEIIHHIFTNNVFDALLPQILEKHQNEIFHHIVKNCPEDLKIALKTQIQKHYLLNSCLEQGIDYQPILDLFKEEEKQKRTELLFSRPESQEPSTKTRYNAVELAVITKNRELLEEIPEKTENHKLVPALLISAERHDIASFEQLYQKLKDKNNYSPPYQQLFETKDSIRLFKDRGILAEKFPEQKDLYTIAKIAAQHGNFEGLVFLIENSNPEDWLSHIPEAQEGLLFHVLASNNPINALERLLETLNEANSTQALFAAEMKILPPYHAFEAIKNNEDFSEIGQVIFKNLTPKNYEAFLSNFCAYANTKFENIPSEIGDKFIQEIIKNSDINREAKIELLTILASVEQFKANAEQALREIQPTPIPSISRQAIQQETLEQLIELFNELKSERTDTESAIQGLSSQVMSLTETNLTLKEKSNALERIVRNLEILVNSLSPNNAEDKLGPLLTSIQETLKQCLDPDAELSGKGLQEQIIDFLNRFQRDAIDANWRRFNSELKDKNNKIIEIEQTIRAQSDNLLTQQGTIQALETKNNELISQLQDLKQVRTENVLVNQDNSNLTEENVTLRQKISSLQSQNQELQGANQSLLRSIEEKDSKIEKNTAEIREIREQIEQSTSRFANLTAKNNQLKSELAAKHLENQGLQQEIATTKKTLDNAQKELQQTRTQNASLQTSIEELQSQTSALKQQISDVNSSQERLLKQLTNIQTLINLITNFSENPPNQNLGGLLTSIRETLKKCLVPNDEVGESKLHEISEFFTNYEQQFKESLAKNKESYEQHIMTLAETLTKTQEALKAKIDGQQTTVQTLESELRDLKTENKQLQLKLKDNQSERAKFEDTITRSQTQINELESRLNKSQEEKQEIETELTAQKQGMAALKENMNMMNEELSILTQSKQKLSEIHQLFPDSPPKTQIVELIQSALNESKALKDQLQGLMISLPNTTNIPQTSNQEMLKAIQEELTRLKTENEELKTENGTLKNNNETSIRQTAENHLQQMSQLNEQKINIEEELEALKQQQKAYRLLAPIHQELTTKIKNTEKNSTLPPTAPSLMSEVHTSDIQFLKTQLEAVQSEKEQLTKELAEFRQISSKNSSTSPKKDLLQRTHDHTSTISEDNSSQLKIAFLTWRIAHLNAQIHQLRQPNENPQETLSISDSTDASQLGNKTPKTPNNCSENDYENHFEGDYKEREIQVDNKSFASSTMSIKQKLHGMFNGMFTVDNQPNSLRTIPVRGETPNSPVSRPLFSASGQPSKLNDSSNDLMIDDELETGPIRHHASEPLIEVQGQRSNQSQGANQPQSSNTTSNHPSATTSATGTQNNSTSIIYAYVADAHPLEGLKKAINDVETLLTLEQSQRLQTPEGLEVKDPNSKETYQISQTGQVTRAFIPEGKHIDDKENLALTIMNIVENVISKGKYLNIETDDVFMASIANKYATFLKGEMGLAIEYRKPKNINFQDPQNQSEIHRASAVFDTLKTAMNLETGLNNAPWFKAAQECCKTNTNTLSIRASGI